MLNNATLKASSERSTECFFGLIMGGVCAVLAVYIWWNKVETVWVYGLAAVSVFFFLSALVIPTTLRPLNVAWTNFGELLHRIVSPIVMGVIFFMVITPVGLGLRLLGKDILRLRTSPNTTSYWLKCDDEDHKSSMLKQF
jgi:hypothetical protein